MIVRCKEFRCIGDRVLIRPDPISDRSRSGLLVLPFKKEHANAPAGAVDGVEAATGIVVGMGPGLMTKNGPKYHRFAPHYRWPMPSHTFMRRVLYYREGGYKIELPVTINDETIYVEHLIVHETALEAMILTDAEAAQFEEEINGSQEKTS